MIHLLSSSTTGFVPDSIKKIKLVLTIPCLDAGTEQIFAVLEILLLLYVEVEGLSEWECLDDDETLLLSILGDGKLLVFVVSGCLQAFPVVVYKLTKISVLGIFQCRTGTFHGTLGLWLKRAASSHKQWFKILVLFFYQRPLSSQLRWQGRWCVFLRCDVSEVYWLR